MAGKPTPVPISNRPGLDAVQARGARRSAILHALRRGLSDANRPGLANLRPDEEDFTLALMDAFAGVLDGLGFYRERIANEQYLRTATERESLRAHARLVGYELAPAKAASVDLAFVAEPAGAPEEIMEFAAGLQVRSVPRDGEVPQIFETVEPLRARPDWNAMRPRLSFPQVLAAATSQMQLAQGATIPELGAPVLLMQGNRPLPDGGTSGTFLRRVTAIADGIAGRKIVSLAAQPAPPSPFLMVMLQPVTFWATPPSSAPPSTSALTSALTLGAWPAFGLTSLVQGLSLSAANAAVTAAAAPPASTAPILPVRMKTRAGFFGATAVTGYVTAAFDSNNNAVAKSYSRTGPGALDATPAAVNQTPPSGSAFVYLDREEPAITAGQVLLIRDQAVEAWFYVQAAEATAVEAWGQSARVTRVQVAPLGTIADGTTVSLGRFSTRTAQAYAVPQPLTLSDLPLTANFGVPDGGLTDAMVELDRVDLGLIPGQRVAVSGQRADLLGVAGACVLQIQANTVQNGRSILTFTNPPPFPLIRDSVTMNANIAAATHGESVSESLGDGDATRTFQSFTLKSKGLTFVSAPGASGMAPALEVRVSNVLWTRVDDFRAAGPEDRVYLLRLSEDGTARILFGDGRTGARLPTAQGAVTATYRRGAGAAGLLEAGQLTLLAGKPAGIKSVTNPLPPAGASDGETLDEARRNAPLTVMTLGRVVSLRDHEDFARAFGGIAKARAVALTDGATQTVHLTVAGTGGVILPETGADFQNLATALTQAGEASLRITLQNHAPLKFTVAARLYADPAYEGADLLTRARDALLADFGLDARALAEGVSPAQVIASLQKVAGVLGVDLDQLRLLGETAQPPRRLPDASTALPPAPAFLLTIDPASLTLEIA